VRLSISTPYDQHALPHEAQIAAWRWLRDHETQVATVVLAATFDEYPGYRSEWLSHYPDEKKRLPVIRNPAGLAAVMGLHDVHVHVTVRDGLAYVGFEFGCNWEDEHGFGVLTHSDRVIEIGDAHISFAPSTAIVEDGGVDLESESPL
jgi:hypothetical protein